MCYSKMPTTIMLHSQNLAFSFPVSSSNRVTMRVLVLTFGTRGDIQPYIGLCTALIAAGHEADICTHPMHKLFIQEFGVGFVTYPGPHPQQLFDYCVRVGIFSHNFMAEISQLAFSFMSSWGQVAPFCSQSSARSTSQGAPIAGAP